MSDVIQNLIFEFSASSTLSFSQDIFVAMVTALLLPF